MHSHDNVIRNVRNRILQAFSTKTLHPKRRLSLFPSFFMSVLRCVTKLDPVRLEGAIIHGFKRGTKLLDCPTANVCPEVVQDQIRHFKMGVYFGWTSLKGVIYKMVANIGRNPSFSNEGVSVEVHLLHSFDEDFYDENLKVLIIGSIRTESKFSSVEELKMAIHEDCRSAERLLDEEQYSIYRNDPFLLS